MKNTNKSDDTETASSLYKGKMHIASAAISVKFHQFPSGNVIYNYQPGTKVDGPMRSISWSKDGNWLALVPHSGLTEIISIRDQLKLMHTVNDVDEPSCASFQNTTKKFVALGTKSGQVLIYDVKSRAVKKRFPRTTSLISHVEFLPKDTHLTASSANGDILIYNNVTNNLSCSFRIPRSGSVTALRNNTNKKNLIAAGSGEGIIAVWDIYVNKYKFNTQAHSAPVTSVVFSPVNSDLVLSTGLDRQFCFHDTSTRQCISSIPVENNITAADFSTDGVNFVLASQNGKIYIYDARRIQEPVFTFEGHKSAVKHLLFQKTEAHETSFIGEPHESSIKQEVDSEIEKTSKGNSDSFGLFIEGSENTNDDFGHSPLLPSPEAGDSFMAAMGLEGSNAGSIRTEKSLTISEGVKKWMDSKTQMNDTPVLAVAGSSPSIKPKRYLQDKMILYESKVKQTSTPKYLSQDVLSNISPIVGSSQAPVDSIKIQELSTLVKDTVKTEMKDFVTTLTKDIDFQVKTGVSQLRRICLDLHMAMIKEFIKLENNLNGLREDVTGELPLADHLLLEENVRLKKRIAELEDQLGITNDHEQNGMN